MSEQPEARLQVHGAGELAELVPYLIGFQPEESLVIVVVVEGREVAVTARTDIADVRPPGQAEALIARLSNRHPGLDAYIIAFTDDPATGWQLVRRCEDQLPRSAGAMTMVVQGNTWRTGDGQAGILDPHGPAAAQAEQLGLPRAERRTDLEAKFVPAAESEELNAAVEKALEALPSAKDRQAVVAKTLALLGQCLPASPDSPTPGTPTSLGQHEALQLAILALHASARDAALLSIDHNNAPQHLDLWRQVINHTPAYAAEMPLYLAGMAAWVSGDGATAAITLQRSQAVAERPGPRPSDLLESLLDKVVGPSMWDQARTDILAQTDPAVRHALRHQLASGSRSWERVSTPKAQRPRPHLHTTPITPPPPGIAP